MNATAICYLVCWKYSDNSGYGVVGYSFNKEQAEAIQRLMSEHGETRQFYITETGALPTF